MISTIKAKKIDRPRFSGLADLTLMTLWVILIKQRGSLICRWTHDTSSPFPTPSCSADREPSPCPSKRHAAAGPPRVYFSALILVQCLKILLNLALGQSFCCHHGCQTHTRAHTHTKSFCSWKYTALCPACAQGATQMPALSHRQQEGCGRKDTVVPPECSLVLQRPLVSMRNRCADTEVQGARLGHDSNPAFIENCH